MSEDYFFKSQAFLEKFKEFKDFLESNEASFMIFGVKRIEGSMNIENFCESNMIENNLLASVAVMLIRYPHFFNVFKTMLPIIKKADEIADLINLTEENLNKELDSKESFEAKATILHHKLSELVSKYNDIAGHIAAPSLLCVGFKETNGIVASKSGEDKDLYVILKHFYDQSPEFRRALEAVSTSVQMQKININNFRKKDIN